MHLTWRPEYIRIWIVGGKSWNLENRISIDYGRRTRPLGGQPGARVPAPEGQHGPRVPQEGKLFVVICSRGISRQKFKFPRVKSPRAVTSKSSIMNSSQKNIKFLSSRACRQAFWGEGRWRSVYLTSQPLALDSYSTSWLSRGLFVSKSVSA